MAAAGAGGKHKDTVVIKMNEEDPYTPLDSTDDLMEWLEAAGKQVKSGVSPTDVYFKYIVVTRFANKYLTSWSFTLSSSGATYGISQQSGASTDGISYDGLPSTGASSSVDSEKLAHYIVEQLNAASMRQPVPSGLRSSSSRRSRSVYSSSGRRSTSSRRSSSGKRRSTRRH